MSIGCNHEAIIAAFNSRRTSRQSQAITDAYLDSHADHLLAQLLDSSDDLVFAKPYIAAHLGDFTGEAGDAALRRAVAVTGPRSRDLRCASLLALAKRCGAGATPDLVSGLSASDGSVKDYAVVGLAGAGDDRAWEQVLDYLRPVLRRKRRATGKSEVAIAIAYLAQHVADPHRRALLVHFIRTHWAAIDESDWFDHLWPEARPGGPPAADVPAPNAGAIRAWARDPLFRPRGLP